MQGTPIIAGDEAGIIVAGIALVGFFIRGLKEDALGRLLAASELPQIPKRALPWISLGLGIVFATLTKRHDGATWGASVLGGVVEGIVVGGGAAYVHDLGKGIPRVGGALGILLVLGFVSSACVESKVPRDRARGAVLTIADGVKVADQACASVASAKRDRALALECAEGFDEAREALLVAEEGVDAWDEAASARLACAAKKALGGLDKIVSRLERAGGRAPAVVADARSLGGALAGACRE